jgi:hypothetical protein
MSRFRPTETPRPAQGDGRMGAWAGIAVYASERPLWVPRAASETDTKLQTFTSGQDLGLAPLAG